MHRELKGIKLLLTSLAPHIVLKPLDLGNNAITIRVVGFALTHRIVDILLEWDIDEMPIRRFVV